MGVNFRGNAPIYMSKDFEYYEGSRPLNSGCPFIFSSGNRGTGKSFNWKRYVIRDYLKRGHEFIYLRRTQKDLERCLPRWFDDVRSKFTNENIEITAKKNEFILTRYDGEEIRESYVIGYYYSIGETIKSIPFERVYTILYDEFLPDDGRYLHSSNPFYEPEQLLSAYMTVARGVDKPIRDDVRMIAIANNVSCFNPYYTYFGLDMSGYQGEEYYSKINNGVYGEIVYNKGIAEHMLNSKIGDILSRTRYGQYATQNASLLDNKFNIIPAPKDLRYMLSLYTPYGWVSAWTTENGFVFWREGYDKEFKRKYKIVNIPEYPFPVPYLQGPTFQTLKVKFANDYMYYENGKVKSAIAGLFMSGVVNRNYR